MGVSIPRSNRQPASEHAPQLFATEDDLRRAFQTAHDLIYKASARDPASSFDLLSLVIAAKILDEQEVDPASRAFSAGGNGREASNLNDLLVRAQHWLDISTDEVHVLPNVRLEPALARGLVDVFDGYSLTLTAESLAGADTLGTAYEAMVGATFRGELGAYFTPRVISEFIARMLDIRGGRVADPACGTGGLLIAMHRHARGEVECFGNDINPRMVHAARVNFLLHRLDRHAISQGDGLDLARMMSTWFDTRVIPEGHWWDAISNGPFDAVIANPPFAGHEQDDANLRRIASAARTEGGYRALNRTIPFLEAIVAMLRTGGKAGLVIPTSILNAEEESFVRFRELLLKHVELRAIIGLPERAFVHTDCGVHGALLFFERVSKPRDDYPLFVAWARKLGYDRLGRDVPDNDLPAIANTFHAGNWPAENTFSLRELRGWGRFDPAWLGVARSLPDSSNKPSGEFVALTDIVEIRDARISRRTLEHDTPYRYFEVSDTDIETGEILVVHEAYGWELQRKSRIKNLTRTGDILLPNHRDSLIARSAPTGRSAVTVDEPADGVLTTDRFIVLRPLIDPSVVIAVLNSAGVRRQLVAQTRGAASLDIRERTLSSVLVPRELVFGDTAVEISRRSAELKELRSQLSTGVEQQRHLIESAFGGQDDFRPAAFNSH